MIEKENFSLKNLNTFAIPVIVKKYFEVKSEKDIQELVKRGIFKEKVFILGGGSNTLFTKDFDGSVIKIKLKGIKKVKQEGNSEVYEVCAGEDWHETVMYFVDMNLGGLENLSFIPGLVGASPIQNIGAYGVEAKDVIAYVDAVDLKTGEIRRFSNYECEFKYRDSVFKNRLKGKYLVTKVAFKLKKKPKLNTTYGDLEKELLNMNPNREEWSIKDVSNAVIKIRKTKLPDPKELGTAGSFFKNPIIPKAKYEAILKDYPNAPSYAVDDGNVKLPAAWLIDTLGWKGWTSENGNYGIHKNHALVIVNYGGATGAEIVDLAMKIKESVKEKFGINLEPEVNII